MCSFAGENTSGISLVMELKSIQGVKNLTNKAEDAQAEPVKPWFASQSGMRASEI